MVSKKKKTEAILIYMYLDLWWNSAESKKERIFAIAYINKQTKNKTN